MKVLWIIPSYPSQTDPVTGVFLKIQAEALVSMGVQVQAVAPVPWIPGVLGRFTKHWEHYRLVPKEYTANGVQLLRPRYLALPGQNYWRCGYIMQRNAVMSLQLSPTDLVHGHFAYPQGFIAGSLAQLWNVPAILTLRGGDVNVFPNINPFVRKHFAGVLRSMDAVLALSEALAEKALTLSGVSATVLRTGTNLDHFACLPGKKQARIHLGLPQQAFIVAYMGSLIEAKGVKDLLAALQKLRGQEILGVFVGGGPLHHQVARSEDAVAVGWKKPEEVPQFLAAADLLALPSYMEGLPNAIVEAGAAGLPVIGTQVGGIPELLGEQRGYLVQPQSVEKLSQAISHIKHNYGEALARAALLRKHVFENYDIMKNTQALANVYASLMRHRNA